ncbi:hypothetical protein HAPAU_30670 [Halalkalicoccus paucihalophilus]|uniref:Uncharacterized protein n=1 Tax=Halalkalicoccus paucihalophilus TaxID=1008153 RepID=A0A151AAH8_9EURY|nr:hypothetical protein HAPAU_30670 [Halalkalicoccus paucihalophilus]
MMVKMMTRTRMMNLMKARSQTKVMTLPKMMTNRMSRMSNRTTKKTNRWMMTAPKRSQNPSHRMIVPKKNLNRHLRKIVLTSRV